MFHHRYLYQCQSTENTHVTRLHTISTQNISKTQAKYKFYSVYQNGKAFKFHIQSEKSGRVCDWEREREGEILSPINIHVYYLTHIGFQPLDDIFVIVSFIANTKEFSRVAFIVTPFVEQKALGNCLTSIVRSSSR